MKKEMKSSVKALEEKLERWIEGSIIRLFGHQIPAGTIASQLAEAMENGFNGMRVTGEMACFIDHSLVEDLIEYEKALHTILDIPMTAVCAYNADSLAKVDKPIDVYSELVKAHGKVLFAGKDSTEGKIEIRIA